MSAYAPPTRASVPPGWVPPYQGPPPIPANMNVNQQQWNAGHWQFNSAFSNQRPAPQYQMPWQPGQAWPQMSQHFQATQRQQPQNPYKKTVREPSAEYLASSLSDNPLGLHGLVPLENRYGDEGQPDAPTPWIWNPDKLADDDAPPPGATITNVSHGNASRPSVASRSRQLSDPLVSSQQRVTADARNARHATDPAPTSGKASVEHGRNRTPPSSIPSSSSRDALPKLDRPLARPKDPDFYRRRGLSPPKYSDHNLHIRHTSSPVQDHSPPTAPPVSAQPAPESFTAKQELVPTFSSGIIRTPEYYRNSSRSSSVSSTRENSQGSMDSVTSRIQRLSISSGSSSSRPEPLTRHSSMPSTPSSTTSESSISGSTLVDEPSSMLSPLMIAQTPKPNNTRPVERHYTYPDMSGASAAQSLATISESPANTMDLTPVPARRMTLQQHTPPESHPSPSTVRRSDESPARGRATIYAPAKYTPPRDNTAGHTLHPSPGSGGGTSSSSSRHRDAPLIPNSLPSPLTPTHSHEGEPVPRVYTKIAMPAPPNSGVSRAPRRRGFWNRRGDHFYVGYVVYAPVDLAYPEELKDYPHEDVGYRDEFGSELKYDPERSELPDSLPLKGQPPVKPYRSFIVYDNQPYPQRPSSSVRIS